MQTKPIQDQYEVHALSSRKIVTKEDVAENAKKISGRTVSRLQKEHQRQPRLKIDPFHPGSLLNVIKKKCSNGETNIKKNENGTPWKFNLSSIG